MCETVNGYIHSLIFVRPYLLCILLVGELSLGEMIVGKDMCPQVTTRGTLCTYKKYPGMDYCVRHLRVGASHGTLEVLA